VLHLSSDHQTASLTNPYTVQESPTMSMMSDIGSPNNSSRQRQATDQADRKGDNNSTPLRLQQRSSSTSSLQEIIEESLQSTKDSFQRRISTCPSTGDVVKAGLDAASSAPSVANPKPAKPPINFR
jgi:hypothetical protein